MTKQEKIRLNSLIEQYLGEANQELSEGIADIINAQPEQAESQWLDKPNQQGLWYREDTLFGLYSRYIYIAEFPEGILSAQFFGTDVLCDVDSLTGEGYKWIKINLPEGEVVNG